MITSRVKDLNVQFT